uniref:protein-glutamine gamma-glutamyltransferase n=1 Tax=Phallusia mammillata TaxID=59560 RepID=A0A6F9DUS6_9ASCI|nr:transglutaminase [Phallusia mammillata]
MSKTRSYTEDAENVQEFLDKNPNFVQEYLNRNPAVVDKYVVTSAELEDLQEWQAAIKKREMGTQLKLAKIDYLPKKNTFLHKTDKYTHNNLIVRRAATFSLDLFFQKQKFDAKKNKIWLEFSIGPDPKSTNGTKLRMQLSDAALNKAKWSGQIVKQEDASNKISVDVTIPADAMIGRYKVTVEVASEVGGQTKTERTTKPDIIVIFNPFSQDDDCYMPSAAEQEEYVLNDTGLIYIGSSYFIRPRHWLFGQFEEGVLDVCLKLLRGNAREKTNQVKSLKKRASPAKCSRLLSSMINSCDNRGVLEGNWTGEYGDGKKPTAWQGSVKILRQWGETEQPVKYGQCWVFSGVLTTVLRALGIPARSITNFGSAHDTEFNETIDRFYDEDGEKYDHRSGSDSIWNFHVWNEAFFKRPDLIEGYDGWQAVDATPQEESGGIMQCGPAPVKAIKNGETYIGSDTNFLFSEVNADVLTWSVDSSGEVTGLVKRDTRKVGMSISTKAVGKDEREDVTNQYKFMEGTGKERLAFERAYAHGRKADYHDKFVLQEEGPITIDISSVGDSIIGKTITTKVQVQNTTNFNRDVIVTTVMNTMLNNEEKKACVKRIRKEVKIAAGMAYEEDIPLTTSEYWSQLVDDNVIRVTTTVRVKQNGNLYVDVFDILPEIPQCLSIECPDELRYYEDNEVTLVFQNMFPILLTEGAFDIEIYGIKTNGPIKASGPIAPGATEKVKINAHPTKLGPRNLMADFDCKEFQDMKARKYVVVGGSA